MLKRRQRFAATQLQLFARPAPTTAPDAERSHVPAEDRAWPEPVTATRTLWLCVCPPALPAEERLRESTLRELAEQALEYTPVVSLTDCGAVLLEIAGSVGLFGGLEGLRRRVLAAFCDGRPEDVACAPTPRAALWLARAGQAVACTDTEVLRSALAGLPLACTGWSETVRKQLAQMGVRTLGECMRLPRAGFARRIGAACLHELDEALGRRAQVLRHYVPPDRFRSSLDLNGETLATEELGEALGELLARLADFLRQRQLGVQQLRVWLQHCLREATPLSLALREPCVDPDELMALLRLRLEAVALPAPVTGLVLEAVSLSPACYASRGLPGVPEHSAATTDERLLRLAERLRARLGFRSVYGLGLVPEHRPERAWRVAESPGRYASAAADSRAVLPGQPRPCWLLPRPRRISSPQGDDRYGCAERIETGWWDGDDVRRDYYAVDHGQGKRWWVYRDRRDAGWYLHGIFG